jgi:hypothetical protein
MHILDTFGSYAKTIMAVFPDIRLVEEKLKSKKRDKSLAEETQTN